MTQSRKHEEVKLDDETHEEFDKRTFMSKLHVTPKGTVAIPGFAIKQAIVSACSLLNARADGKRDRNAFGVMLTTGINVYEDADVGVPVEDVRCRPIFANLDGKRGSAKRGLRFFPEIQPGWKATVEITVLNDTLPQEDVERFLIAAGKFIGLGQYRAERGGTNGRFRVASMSWANVED